MNKQNPIRVPAATKIRYFSDRLLGLFETPQGARLRARALERDVLVLDRGEIGLA